MRNIDVETFVRRFKDGVNRGTKFTFFLGAGCSVSSGIPGAASLVRDRWLPRLNKMETGETAGLEGWVKGRFPEYEPENAGGFYAPVIEELFIDDAAAQREIEDLCQGVDPGFGYAVLASLMADDKYGERCNVVLTTNFDDLVADALYLYTKKKPLVITHEALIGYFKITRLGPTVVKLHGDAHLEPKNFEADTADLDENVKTVISNLLCETGLIFVGYGGNDKSIATLLGSLPIRGALPGGVYWVRNTVPDTEIGRWLEGRNAVHVEHTDFDELLLLVKTELGLPPPDWERFDELRGNHFETLKGLQDKIAAKAASREKEALEEAFNRTVAGSEDWRAVELEARKYKEKDAANADRIYRAGIEKFPQSYQLLGTYALFLKHLRKDYDAAEGYYRRALELEPKDANNLGSYANFLCYTRKDFDAAEGYYRRALEAEPKHATNLSSYGNFLGFIRKDYDAAEGYYRRALEAEPKNATTLGIYANFLYFTRKDYDAAEEYFKRALELEPRHAHNLSNYANILYLNKKDYDAAEGYYRRALELEPKDAVHLGNYAGFLLSRGRASEGFEKLEQALALAEGGTLKLECQFYRYAHERGEAEREEALAAVKGLIKAGVRSPGWDLSQSAARAVKDGHPEPEFLGSLAKVIAAAEEADVLEKFRPWRISS